MCYNEKQFIHELFKTRDYIRLYHTQTKTIQKMLFVNSQKEFEDFLEYNDCIEEDVFWLYYSVTQGESLLIGGYDEDVSKTVEIFLMKKLPEKLFCNIAQYIQNLYVDLGTKNNIEKQIAICTVCQKSGFRSVL